MTMHAKAICFWPSALALTVHAMVSALRVEMRLQLTSAVLEQIRCLY